MITRREYRPFIGTMERISPEPIAETDFEEVISEEEPSPEPTCYRNNRPFIGKMQSLSPEPIDDTDFEEESLSPEPTTYKQSKDVLSEENTFTIDIGNGVNIRTTTQLGEEMNSVRAETWTKEERNSSLQIRNLTEGMEFVSPDIYQIKMITKNSSDIWNSTEQKLPKNKQCSFSLADEFENNVTFIIPMNEKIKCDENVFTYSAWIECGKEWKSVEAKIQGKCVEFNCHRLNSFGIVRFPKNIKHIIKPGGSKLAVDEGGSLVVEFEPGTVKIEQSITMSTQRPSKRYLRHSADPRRLVTAATEKISLSCDKTQLNKQLKVIGTLQREIENSSDIEGDIKLVTYQNNVPSVMDKIPKRTSRNQYEDTVDCFDSLAIVSFKKHSTKSPSFPLRLKDEMDLVYGNKIPCHILLFYVRKRDQTMLEFTAECCLSENVVTIKQNHVKMGHILIFRSDELILPLQQRIRIHPSGCIEYKAGREPHFFLFFMHVANVNSVDFSVVVNRRLGTSSNAIIEFAADNNKRGEITRAEFNAETVGKINQKRPGLQRTQSYLSVNEMYRKPVKMRKNSTPITE